MPSPTIVITGATSGLGQLAAIRLAERGANLILPVRNPARASATQALITAAAPKARVELYTADLSLMADVRRVGDEIAGNHPRIDVLINNAGLHAFEPRTTPDGFPEMVAVNYFAPWLLTRSLLPSLAAAPTGRVVTVGSEASRRHGTLLVPDDLTATVPFTARGSSEHYGRSKLLDIMFALELARRLDGTGVTSNCLDPGFNVTGLGRELPGAAALERVLTTLRIGDPARGAGLIVRLAVDPAFAARTGQYWTVRGPRAITPTAPADDLGRRRELWEATEQILVDESETSEKRV